MENLNFAMNYIPLLSTLTLRYAPITHSKKLMLLGPLNMPGRFRHIQPSSCLKLSSFPFQEDAGLLLLTILHSRALAYGLDRRLFLCPHYLKPELCVVRSQPVGRHWEVELLPQAGGGAAAGHSLTADLHQRGATQPHDSTVSPTSDISGNGPL